MAAASNSWNFKSVPILDYNLVKTDYVQFLENLRSALEDVGFFLLTNVPGLEDSFQQEIFALCKGLFSKDEEWKKNLSMDGSPCLRGYFRNDTADGPHRAWSELFRLGTELELPQSKEGEEIPFWLKLHQGPNQWPDIPNFRAKFERLYKRSEEVIHELDRHACELFKIPVDVPQSYYPKTEETEFSSALWHYFPLSEESRKTEKNGFVIGLNEHRDLSTFFTMTFQNRAGLQIQNHSGEWIDVPVLPSGIICNVGGQLMKLTGGKVVATTHRVNTMKIDSDRYTVAFALNTQLDKTVTPLPQFENSAKKHVMPRPPVTKVSAIEDPLVRSGYVRLQLFPSVTKKLYPKEWEAAQREGIL